MQSISLSALPSLIATLSAKGARPITLTIETEAKLNAYGNTCYPEGVTKHSRVNGMLNANYEKSVNRQQVREGATEGGFKVRPNWFVHTEVTGVVAHREDSAKLYLQIKLEKVIESHYTVNGVGIPFELDSECMPAKSMPKNQGTKKPVLTFTVGLDNIRQIVCDGETYQIGASEGTHSVPQWGAEWWTWQDERAASYA